MSDDSDASPHQKRKRKARRLEDSSSESSSDDFSAPVRTRTKSRNRNPIADSSSDSDSDDSCVVRRRKKKVARVTSDSDSDNSSGSSIVVRIRSKSGARILSASESDSSQWETEGSDAEPDSRTAVAASVQDANVDSDSSDGQSDKCPICLATFRTQEIGTPESCDHQFCLECIQEWSKNMNTCPVDRQEYNLILVRRQVNGKVARQIPIEKPQPQNDVEITEELTFCEICGQSEYEDRMLLCDGCDLGFHLFCLTPPLDEVPAGRWYCNDCSADDVVDREISLFEIQMLFDDQVNMIQPTERRRNQSSRYQYSILGRLYKRLVVRCKRLALISHTLQHISRPSIFLIDRLIPRTRQSERVRRQIQTNRMNQSLRLQQEMPSTSSGADNSIHLSDGVTSTTSRRTAGTARKPRKKKTRKTKRRRRVFEVDEATGEMVEVKRKKRKSRAKTRRRNRVVARPKTVKKRLAAQLGICAPKSVPQNLPDVRVPSTTANSIGVMRHQAGIPALHLFGQNHELDYFSDEDIDGSDILVRRAPNHSDVAAMRRTARRKAVVIPCTVSSSSDLLDSIMDSQERLHSRNTVFSVDRDGKFKMEPKLGNNNNNYINVKQQDSVVRQCPTSYTNKTTSNSNNYREDAETSREYHGNSSYQHSTPSSTMEPAAGSRSSSSNDQDQPQDYSQRTLSASCDATYDDPDKNKKGSDSGSNSPNSDSDVDIYSDIETVSTSKVDDDESYNKPPPQPAAPQNDSNAGDDDDNSETEMVIDTEKEPEKHTEHDEEDAKQVTSTVDAEIAPQNRPQYSASEIQSEAVQSSNQVDYLKNDYQDKDQYDDDDSEDGCPNFSIYSKESIKLAKDSDVGNNESGSSGDNQVGEVSSSPNGPERSVHRTQDVAGPSTSQQYEAYDPEMETESPRPPEDIDDDDQEENKPDGAEESRPTEVMKKPNVSSGGLYSDSEDESVVRKEAVQFGMNDLRNMTEDISEEERSYTPCLDEKNTSFKEGIEGLDTELISDEDRNDFDESHEQKAVSDGGDALEINAKESELDFTRPEDYEEGEIIDKLKNSKKPEEEPKKEDESPKKAKKKEKTADNEGNKENEVQNKETFKKLSKSSKDRNYREKDRSKSREKKSDKDKDKQKEKEKKDKKRRKEIVRYNVRALIAVKPKRDQFGRDIPQRKSESRNRSFTPPIRRSSSRPRQSPSPKRRGRSRTRNRNRVTQSRSRNRVGSRSRSRNKLSRSKTPPRRRSRSKDKKRKRSTSRSKKPTKTRTSSKSKRKARSHSRRRSRSKSPRKKRDWKRRRSTDWTPSFSRSPSPDQAPFSPSWTPPRILDKVQQKQQHSNLKVILPNDGGKKKKEKKKKSEKRKDSDRQRKRTRYDRTPPPSKEVFASGENILVSVSFNKENETRDVTTRDKRRKTVEEPPKKKKKSKNKAQRKDLSGVKPVAIIDLERSPFQVVSSPKDVIVLSDSDNGEDVQKNICDSSQQVASPERCGVNTYTMGPKTPPEPQVKFSLNAKPPTIRAISNPLHEADEMDVEPDQEDITDSVHKGPNTPPEPPNSPPSSPDAYDPFEPTKSRSPTPEPLETTQSNEPDMAEADDDKIHNQSPDKSLTPPVADIQPADSQSSIHATPDIKSPERIGATINQPAAKPVAQTTPFSTGATSLINSAPINNLAPPRINIINSTIVQQSSIPQRIVLPNVQKSSPVKIAPTKSIKPMPSKQANNKNSRGKGRQNGASDDMVLDLDSPYSPGSSDYEDLFEPPPESGGKSSKSSSKTTSSKTKSTFDALFGSPSYSASKPTKKDKVKKVQVSPTKGTKQVGVKLDEDNLKILDELPNSAVEMQVKDKVQYLKKLNRQERVVEEVKLVLKPHYNKKRINKEEYKDILRRSVPKICHNKSGEINPTKIKSLIEAYVKKIRHSKKVTSSSSVNPQKV
ncbi:PHD and RING finger domain-containing protein 1 isoform X2 [Aethina tumida]|uniref:PHD and RING finger domain-containing protein 1 isoform X2 n=1 Tax=Aethina tumida TaxID=116153 RepID=UPI002147BDBB|nr:PHD and RING finger domain-containing protein 1 isoform X2 [Aethina tumida]